MSARAFGMTGKIVQGVCVSGEQQLFPAPLTLHMAFCWSMFFCQHVGLQQANCADLPLTLAVITAGGPPIATGPNHFVGFRWNHAGNFGAVSEGATLTDRCLDGLCDSFRRAGLPVHEVTPAALAAETFGMRIIPSHGVCGHTHKRIFSSQVDDTRFDASSSCLRKGRATDCWSSLLWRHCLARSVVPFGFSVIISLRSTGSHLEFRGSR